MSKVKLNLRKVIAIVICLVGFGISANAQNMQRSNYNDGNVLAYVEIKQTTYYNNGGCSDGKRNDGLVIENVSNRTITVKYCYRSILRDCDDNVVQDKITYRDATLQVGEKKSESGYLSNGKRGYFYVESFAIMNVSRGADSASSNSSYETPQIQPQIQSQSQGIQVKVEVTIPDAQVGQQTQSQHQSPQVSSPQNNLSPISVANATELVRRADTYYNNEQYSNAIQLYKQAADQGNADAQFWLGVCYFLGRGGLAEDNSQAVYWYKKAADQGNAYAQDYLGYCYEKGWGVIKDNSQAILWYRKAAIQGIINAQNALNRLEVNYSR